MRLGGVVLDGVHVRGRSGDGIAVDVDEVGVQAGWWGLAFEGSEAIEEVQARGVHARLDASDAGYPASVRAVREAVGRREGRGGPAAGGGGGSPSGPTFSARDVSLEVVDRFGTLMQGSMEEASRTPDGMLSAH